ncbi:MAG: hypothetical protein ACJZ4H_03500 [Candidatus Pelagibacter sp.]
MNKILNYILVFLLFTIFGCAYEPVLNKKNYQFSINISEINGDQQINSIIKDRINFLKKNQNEYELSLITKKEKKIISKDSKGDPATFELLININYIVKKSDKTIIKKDIKRKITYNNITDKFELENYEKNIIENLSEVLSDSIISSISEINK